MTKNKSKATGFEEPFQKSKNILDRLYDREDFKKDIRNYKKMLGIKNLFVKLETLDAKDKNFIKRARERREKYGSGTNVTTEEETNWHKSLADKQLELLNKIGKLLRKKYQKKLNFELPKYVENSILKYLLYGIKEYVVPLYFPGIKLIYDKNNQPVEIRIIKSPSTSVRDIRYVKPLEQWFRGKSNRKLKKMIIQRKIKEKLPRFIKPRWDKTIEIGKKIFRIDKKKKDHWRKTDELFGEMSGSIGGENSKDLGKEEKKRYNKYRQLKHRAKEKMGI